MLRSSDAPNRSKARRATASLNDHFLIWIERLTLHHAVMLLDLESPGFFGCQSPHALGLPPFFCIHHIDVEIAKSDSAGSQIDWQRTCGLHNLGRRFQGRLCATVFCHKSGDG